MFITFEGIDGSGKSTNIKKLKEYIEKNFDLDNFVFTREPGGTNIKECEKIREIILDKDNKIDDMSEMLLYLASRKLHVEQLIKPSLEKGKIVLCDRFYDSSIAYQGNARKIGMDKVEALNLDVLDGLKPNYTFYFKLSFETSIERMNQGKRDFDRLEQEEFSFFKRVIEGYETIIKKDKDRFIIIDASKSKNEVFEQVLDEFKKLLSF